MTDAIQTIVTFRIGWRVLWEVRRGETAWAAGVTRTRWGANRQAAKAIERLARLPLPSQENHI